MARPIFSLVRFFGASRKTKKSNPTKLTKEDKTKRNESTEKKFTQTLSGNFSSKALLMVKMISWKRVHESEDEHEHFDDTDDEAVWRKTDDTDDEAVWRKTIMMGERCRPLDFSGKIEYDCHGNLVSQTS